MRSAVWVGSMCAWLVLASATSAYGARTSWHVDLEAATDFPLQAGVRLGGEGPFGVRASFSIGALPGDYVSIINGLVVAVDGYDQKTADLVEGALNDSLVCRFHAGWRPFEDYGFYADIGYTLATLGGGVGSDTLYAVLVTQGGLPPGVSVSQSYGVESTLHMVDMEVGWLFLFEGGWLLRLALGMSFTVAAHTEVIAEFEPLETVKNQVAEFSAMGTSYLNRVYLDYVHPPTLTVGFGYRFF